MSARRPATGALTPRLTPLQAELLARACHRGGHCYVLGGGAATAIARLIRLRYVRGRVDRDFPIWTARATPLGRWRALGGKRPKTMTRGA